MTDPNLEAAIRDHFAAADDIFELSVYRILAPPDGDHEFIEPVLGIVVDFPNSGVYADWNVDAWPDDDQLDDSHVSIYGSLEDCRQVAEGTLEQLTTIDAYTNLTHGTNH